MAGLVCQASRRTVKKCKRTVLEGCCVKSAAVSTRSSAHPVTEGVLSINLPQKGRIMLGRKGDYDKYTTRNDTGSCATKGGKL